MTTTPIEMNACRSWITDWHEAWIDGLFVRFSLSWNRDGGRLEDISVHDLDYAAWIRKEDVDGVSNIRREVITLGDADWSEGTPLGQMLADGPVPLNVSRMDDESIRTSNWIKAWIERHEVVIDRVVEREA